MRTVPLLLLVSWSTSTVLAKDSTAVYRDSVFARYMKHGAWQQPLFSRERAQLIDSALRLLPTDAYLWQQRSMPLFKQQKYELGMPFVDSAVKYDSAGWLDYRAFLKCIFSKEYRESLEDFKHAERLRPGAHVMDHEYAFYRGICYLQLDRLDSAESCFARCVANDARVGNEWVNPTHLFYLGIVYYEMGRWSQAGASFDLAVQLYPRFADAKYYLARCAMKLGNTTTAVRLLNEAAADMAAGCTLPEHNAIYERYPYQVREDWIAAQLESLTNSSSE